MSASKKSPRVGLGYDIHRLRRGRRLVLGGVDIPHPRGLDGHSDADGLLGSVSAGDIGRHFPTDDPRWRGASSLAILARVRSLLKRKSVDIVHIDAMLIMEAPRVAPHIPAMRANIARALGLPASRVSVKATTNEGLGAVGSGRGICALAVAVVNAP
jgi:2-C-methyl-D-erythritol 2,4-cyclodiphosphate synthase